MAEMAGRLKRDGSASWQLDLAEQKPGLTPITNVTIYMCNRITQGPSRCRKFPFLTPNGR
jgi:hypothetical protein